MNWQINEGEKTSHEIRIYVKNDLTMHNTCLLKRYSQYIECCTDNNG